MFLSGNIFPDETRVTHAFIVHTTLVVPALARWLRGSGSLPGKELDAGEAHAQVLRQGSSGWQAE